ncbi:MAG: shikimate dehydrogenase, partial [Candidatus Limnocylindrales bacterium]
VVYALITGGFQHVIVFNRHLHRAEALVRHFGRSASHMELRAKPWHESVLEAELARTKLLVNASSVGRVPDETPIPAELLPPELMVIDLLYTPRETRLMREAAAAGGTVQNGDIMFIEESAVAFNLWTGQEAPRDLFRATLDAARDSAPEPVAEAAEA